MTTSWSSGSVASAPVETSTLPSGVQPTTTAGSPSQVNRRGSPPAIGITYASAGPSYVAVKATLAPSGEIAARDSMPGWLVSRCATPPPAPTFHRSPSAVNTMVSPWIAGKRV